MDGDEEAALPYESSGGIRYMRDDGLAERPVIGTNPPWRSVVDGDKCPPFPIRHGQVPVICYGI